MKTMRILLFFSLLLVLSKRVVSQKNAFNTKPVNILSPDASNLGKYGAYNVNHYSGNPNISIPIYTINEPDIEVPISISYDASGFIPNRNSSQVGQNWNLTAGGAITRIVKGVPDDKHNYNPDYHDYFTKNDKGYIYGIQNSPPSTYPTQSYVQNLSFLSTNVLGQPIGLLETSDENIDYLDGTETVLYPRVNASEPYVKYEYNPDIFSFNFMGHSGTFVMGNDGEVKVNSNRNYKVDLSNIGQRYDIATDLHLTTVTPDLNSTIISSISITSDDGYKFYFGGKLASLELSFHFAGTAANTAVAPASGVINAWYITKVEKPDGSFITFDYGTYTADEIIVLRNMNSPAGGWQQKEANFMDVKLFLTDIKFNYNLHMKSGNRDNIIDYNSIRKTITKLAYLKKIDTKLYTVDFSYTPKNNSGPDSYYGPTLKNYFFNNLNRNISKLDKITIADKANAFSPLINQGEILTSPSLTFNFLYEYYGNITGEGKYLFLKEVNENNKKYIFDYSRISELPHPLTTGIDKWGFYNGQNANSRLVGISNPTVSDPGEFETNFGTAGRNRLPDPSKVDIGILKSITYPTGGTTNFEFESHKYKKILKRKILSPNTMIPLLETLNNEEYAGGCRIKKIINTPGTTTEFKYLKNFTQNGSNLSSSGLLTANGVFRIRFEVPLTNPIKYYEQLYENNLTSSSGFSEPHICYPEVVEIQHNGSEGFTKYTYTNPDDQDYGTDVACPDNYFLGLNSIRIFSFSQISGASNILPFNNQMKRLARSSSRAAERGNLSKKEIFTNGNFFPINTTEYKYNTDPNRFNEKTVGYELIYNKFFPDNSSMPSFAYFVHSFQIYNYHNSPSQIIEKSNENGQVMTKTTNFTYKSNSNPLLTEKSVTISDGSQFKTQYFYPQDKVGNPDFPSSALMVAKNMVAKVVEEKTFKNNIPITTQQFLYNDATGTGGYKLFTTKTQNHSVSGGSNEVRASISYYTDGMVKEFYKSNDYKTAYIWDYKKTMPIAEVKNVSGASHIAYTSFETNENWLTGGYNQWSYNLIGCVPTIPTPTGGRAFDFSTGGNITRTLDPLVNYIVSVWFNGTSLSVNGLIPKDGETIKQWTLKEYKVSGASSITISGVGKIDELRLYPEKALMTTYCHQPLHGIISSSDANNKITHYSYDTYRRLDAIWDKDLNILKRICYNYFGQPENCIVPCPPNSPANWQNTSTAPTCQQGSCGNTGYQLQEQMDMSTCSSTSGDTRLVEIYNPTVCVPASGANITYQNNAGATGFTATYTSRTNGQVFSFNVPSSGTGILGCIPIDSYSLSISKVITPYMLYLMFSTGCFTQSGTTAYFAKVNVPNCSMVILEAD